MTPDNANLKGSNKRLKLSGGGGGGGVGFLLTPHITCDREGNIITLIITITFRKPFYFFYGNLVLNIWISYRQLVSLSRVVKLSAFE